MRRQAHAPESFQVGVDKWFINFYDVKMSSNLNMKKQQVKTDYLMSLGQSKLSWNLSETD